MKEGLPRLTAEEAAAFIKNGDAVACSGFSAAGSPKVILESLAKRAEILHEEGKEFQIKLFTGASSSDHVDGVLSRAKAVSHRFPYQSSKDMRTAINAGEVAYADLHLSGYPQFINYGFLGPIDVACVEVADYTEKGELVLTAAVGASPTFCHNAKHILLEHNTYHPKSIVGMHDLYELENPPHRKPIPLTRVRDRIGCDTLKIDPKKIIGIVETCAADGVADFKEINAVHEKIGQHVAEFFVQEIAKGRIPKTFLPVQSGVGNIANAVLKTMGLEKRIPAFEVYSEVAQDAVFELMEIDRVSFTSACSLTLTNARMQQVYQNWDFYKNRLVLRPEEITNHPEIIRRLGLLTLNAALEVDCFGNVNSTHVFGTNLMNGIGGSGDFARNGYISIFTLPSTAKNGTISSIVPFCSHIDHTEHDTQIIITEQGVADLRGKSPEERSKCIIENCVHPDYKPILRAYLKRTKNKHITHDLSCAFALYESFAKTGDMRNCQF